MAVLVENIKHCSRCTCDVCVCVCMRVKTHSGYEELLDLLHRSPHLDFSSGLCVFHCDQDMKVFI